MPGTRGLPRPPCGQVRRSPAWLGLVLFGSRARGNHREDSDADVAVFLGHVADPIAEQMDLAEDAYLLYLDLDLMIQPWVFRGTPRKPDPTRAAHLLEVVRSEGITV